MVAITIYRGAAQTMLLMQVTLKDISHPNRTNLVRHVFYYKMKIDFLVKKVEFHSFSKNSCPEVGEN